MDRWHTLGVRREGTARVDGAASRAARRPPAQRSAFSGLLSRSSRDPRPSRTAPPLPTAGSRPAKAGQRVGGGCCTRESAAGRWAAASTAPRGEGEAAPLNRRSKGPNP